MRSEFFELSQMKTRKKITTLRSAFLMKRPNNLRPKAKSETKSYLYARNNFSNFLKGNSWNWRKIHEYYMFNA